MLPVCYDVIYSTQFSKYQTWALFWRLSTQGKDKYGRDFVKKTSNQWRHTLADRPWWTPIQNEQYLFHSHPRRLKKFKNFFLQDNEKKSDQKGKLSWRILSQIHLCGAN